MNQAALHQTIIDLRTDLIKKRIKEDKQCQVIKLQEQRIANLESALKSIMERCKGNEAYTNEAFIHHIAYKAIHSD